MATMATDIMCQATKWPCCHTCDDDIPFHLVDGVFCERMCVAKANVEFVGCSFGTDLIQNFHHPFPLGRGPALDG